MKTQVQRAEERKWYARLWWIALHVYDYSALAYVGAFTPKALGTSDFVTFAVVGLLNLAAYTRLQWSSPGFVTASSAVRDLEAGKKTGGNDDRPVADAAGESDADLLVPRSSSNESADVDTSATVNRFCDDCQMLQPMRTKHCKDCNRCVLQYDHHCDCAGTCIGQNNRHAFIFYLFIQTIEAFLMLGVAASAFTLQSSIDEWLVANMPFIVAWFSIFCVLLIAGPLLCYQLFLISTNQTSWEHARRDAITYLKHLPDEKSPFDRGILGNWWVFVRRRNANVWVHASAKPQHSPVQADSSYSDTSLM